MKQFDKIDIIFIVLISIYLLVLFIGILWFILDKIEKNIIYLKKILLLTNKQKKRKRLLKNKLKQLITIIKLLIKNKHLLRKHLLQLKKPPVKQLQLRKPLIILIILIKLNLQQLKRNQTILKEKLDMYHQLKERKLTNAKKGI